MVKQLLEENEQLRWLLTIEDTAKSCHFNGRAASFSTRPISSPPPPKVSTH